MKSYHFIGKDCFQRFGADIQRAFLFLIMILKIRKHTRVKHLYYVISSLITTRFIADAYHGHTLQLSAGLSVLDSRLVVNSNPVRG